jgi:hypothetical protein
MKTAAPYCLPIYWPGMLCDERPPRLQPVAESGCEKGAKSFNPTQTGHNRKTSESP